MEKNTKQLITSLKQDIDSLHNCSNNYDKVILETNMSLLKYLETVEQFECESFEHKLDEAILFVEEQLHFIKNKYSLKQQAS